ncbi:putative DNA-binding protein with PD1-like motif [Sporosarcina luteola]|nr:putative DNA-binding protein with PD1-like motif [Sporosarcina luteola]
MDNRIQAVLDNKTNRIAGRFKKGIDLFEGFKEVCRIHQVTAAHFQCIGSLEYATYVQLDQTAEGGLAYSKKKKTDTPIELLSGTGFIGLDMQGKLDVHFHGTFIDCEKKIDGGHFIDGENPVAVTIEYLLFPLHEVALQRGNDEFWGMPVFQFTKEE